MLQYVFAGVALGSIYAIAASALVVTYVSSGVLNFAFGSMAYVVARFYYWLNSEHHMSTFSSGLLAILVLAPVLGIVLYAVLFRFVRGRSQLIKLVTTIGLSVALPPISNLVFGTQTITSAPGLASLSDKPFKVFGAAVTTDQVIIYGFLVFIVIGGTAVLRFTDVGLRVRAMVDSEAMTSLSGTSPNRVSIGVWAVSATLAGLAGVLVAPTNGLSTVGMTTLMAAAFAAVVVARLRSLPGAVVAALAMGIVTDVIQKYLPPNSSFTAAIIPSIPFAFIAVALIIQSIQAKPSDDGAGVGGPLDKAIKPANLETEDSSPARGGHLPVGEGAQRGPAGRRGGTAPHLRRVGVLARVDGPRHVLRHRVPHVHDRDGRGRDAVAVADHLCRWRCDRGGTVRERLAHPGTAGDRHRGAARWPWSVPSSAC